MALHFKAGGLAALFFALGGCATVSVIESSQVADISLTSSQDNLERTTKSYHKTVRKIGVEETSSAFDMLSSWFSDEKDDANAYWRRVKADTGDVDQVRNRISADVIEVAARLAEVNKAAADLTGETAEDAMPTKKDVADVETVLISVRHAREAFREALDMANTRTSLPENVDLVLSSLDQEIEYAAKLADQLAAARMSGALSLIYTTKI